MNLFKDVRRFLVVKMRAVGKEDNIMDKIKEFLPFLIPLVIVQFGLLAYTIRHILTHDSYRRGSRGLWLFVSLVGMQFWGPILYFALGKQGEE